MSLVGGMNGAISFLNLTELELLEMRGMTLSCNTGTVNSLSIELS